MKNTYRLKWALSYSRLVELQYYHQVIVGPEEDECSNGTTVYHLGITYNSMMQVMCRETCRHGLHIVKKKKKCFSKKITTYNTMIYVYTNTILFTYAPITCVIIQHNNIIWVYNITYRQCRYRYSNNNNNMYKNVTRQFRNSIE